MWAFEQVMCKQSFRSCDNKSHLFSTMFPDSCSGKSFACVQTKCKYSVCFWIAPYCKELLKNSLSEVDHIVCQVDETYNDVLKKSQMDLHVRYWSTATNAVTTRYYTSEFLGKATSKDVFETFKQFITDRDQEKLLQVSMDGPNMNNSFLLMLNKEWKEEELSDLVSIGTCGLHTLHNSFKYGENATEWKLKKVLSSVYKIFHESPSR